MRRTRFLLLALAVILLVVGAGITFLLTLDLNDYKPGIERFVARETGRSFSIEGRIDFDPGALTALSVTGIRFGNPDGGSGGDLARIGRISVVLDVRSLWSGRVILEQLALDDTQINLEQRKSRANNRTFGSGRVSGGGPVPFILRQVHVTNFALTVRTPALARPLEIRVDRLDQVQKSDGLFDAQLRGTLNGHTVNVSGEYGPLESLLTASDLTVDFAGRFDTLSISAAGLIDDLVRPRRPRIDIEMSGPDINDVTGMLGVPDLGSGDVDLKMSLQPGARDIAVSMTGRVGEHRIEAQGSVSDLAMFEQAALHISVQGPDLHEAARLFGFPEIPAGAYRLSGSVARDGTRLELDEINLALGAAQFRLAGMLPQFPDLGEASLTLEIHGEQLGRFTRLMDLPGTAKGPFRAAGQLEVMADGSEAIKLDVTTQVAAFTVDGTFGKGPGLVGMQANVTGHGADIGALAALLDLPGPVTEPFEFAGDLKIGEKVVLLPGHATFSAGGNRLIVTGAVGFEPLGNDTDLRVRIEGSDLAQAGRMAGIDRGVPSAGYEISGRFRTSRDGYRITGLQARIGEAEISADGLVSRRENFTGSRLKISAAGPRLSQVLVDTGTIHFPDGPFSLSGELERLADSIRLTGMKIELDGATGTMNADIGLPLASANGSFELTASGASFRAVLPDTGSWEPPDLPFEIRAQGRLRGGLVQVEPVEIKIGNTGITAEGVFDIPPDLSRTNLAVTARTGSLATIGTFNERYLPGQDFSLNARFSGTPESFSIEGLTARTGDSDLSGSITVALDRTVPDARLKLQSSRLDVTPFINAGPVKEGDGEEESEKEQPAGDERLIPEWTLPLDRLATFTADIDVGIGEYRQNQRVIDNLSLRATVQDGRLDVEHVSGKTLYGSIAAALRIVPTDDTAMVHTEFEGKNIFLGNFRGRSREEIDAEPKYDVYFDLDSTGLTLRDIAANLNGQVRVSADKGRMPNSAMRFFFGGFIEELLTTINPFMKTDPYTDISCVVLFADIDNGIVDMDPGMAMQTSKINIVSKGEIDLHTESLDFGFKTIPRKKLSISAGEFINPYLKVSGTLASPHLTLDPTGTLVTGGAAAATAGVSLLVTSVWNRFFKSADPCAAIVEEANKKRQKKNKQR